MKAISNSQKELHNQQMSESTALKRLIELQNLNKEKESLITKYEEQIKLLEGQAVTLDQQVEQHEQEWKQLQQKMEDEKSEGEEEHQMSQWIEKVQQYNGLPQNIIDSLCSMEFQGGEQQICLSCYQELSAGSMCTYLPCCHLFHKDCIGTHLKINKTCPACFEVVQP